MKKTIRIPEHLQPVFTKLDKLGITYSDYLIKLIENDNNKTIKLLQQESVETDEWYTPKYVLDFLRKEYKLNFTLDPATNKEQMKLLEIDKGYTIKDNGLEQDWNTTGTIWLNPPFSKTKQFLAKARKEMKKYPDLDIMCLLKFQPDSNSWKDYVNGKSHILIPEEKIKFFNDNKETITYGGQTKVVLVWLKHYECGKINFLNINE